MQLIIKLMPSTNRKYRLKPSIRHRALGHQRSVSKGPWFCQSAILIICKGATTPQAQDSLGFVAAPVLGSFFQPLVLYSRVGWGAVKIIASNGIMWHALSQPPSRHIGKNYTRVGKQPLHEPIFYCVHVCVTVFVEILFE